jgi:hypothetical protein
VVAVVVDVVPAAVVAVLVVDWRASGCACCWAKLWWMGCCCRTQRMRLGSFPLTWNSTAARVQRDGAMAALTKGVVRRMWLVLGRFRLSHLDHLVLALGFLCRQDSPLLRRLRLLLRHLTNQSPAHHRWRGSPLCLRSSSIPFINTHDHISGQHANHNKKQKKTLIHPAINIIASVMYNCAECLDLFSILSIHYIRPAAACSRTPPPTCLSRRAQSRGHPLSRHTWSMW